MQREMNLLNIYRRGKQRIIIHASRCHAANTNTCHANAYRHLIMPKKKPQRKITTKAESKNMNILEKNE